MYVFELMDKFNKDLHDSFRSAMRGGISVTKKEKRDNKSIKDKTSIHPSTHEVRANNNFREVKNIKDSIINDKTPEQTQQEFWNMASLFVKIHNDNGHLYLSDLSGTKYTITEDEYKKLNSMSPEDRAISMLEMICKAYKDMANSYSSTDSEESNSEYIENAPLVIDAEVKEVIPSESEEEPQDPIIYLGPKVEKDDSRQEEKAQEDSQEPIILGPSIANDTIPEESKEVQEQKPVIDTRSLKDIGDLKTKEEYDKYCRDVVSTLSYGIDPVTGIVTVFDSTTNSTYQATSPQVSVLYYNDNNFRYQYDMIKNRIAYQHQYMQEQGGII